MKLFKIYKLDLNTKRYYVEKVERIYHSLNSRGYSYEIKMTSYFDESYSFTKDEVELFFKEKKNGNFENCDFDYGVIEGEGDLQTVCNL